MLTRYEVAVLTTRTAQFTDDTIAAFHAGSKPAYVREIHCFLETLLSVPHDLGLRFSTVLGTGTRTEVGGVSLDPTAGASAGRLVTDWATAEPSVAASPAGTLRRWAQSGTVLDAGIIWRWPKGTGLVVPANPAANSELCLVNCDAAQTLSTMTVTVVWEE